MHTLDWGGALRHDAAMAFSAYSPAVRVLVVDDSLRFRDGVRVLIADTAGFELIGEANCGEEGIERAAHLRPDLVLMDVRMPGMGGVEAARQMASRGLRAIVVLVSAEEPGGGLSDDSAGKILPKQRLSSTLLRRLWEDAANST